MRWSEEVTCQFVKCYTRQECLWNKNHEDYKIKYKRMTAYRTIINEFQNLTGIALSDPELSIKIKSLKSTYSQEISKIKQRSTSDWTYKPSLKWFAEWDKCMGKSGGKIGMMSVMEDGTDNTSLENDQEETHEQIWVSNSTEENATDPFTDDYNIIFKLEPNENSLVKERQSEYKTKLKKIKQQSPSTDNSFSTFRGSIDSRTDSIEDEFDIYGKYIAAQLRKMNLQKALKVQLEIQSLVSEARISELHASNSP